MFKKVTNIIFTIIFILTISMPLMFTNLKNNQISADENRKLANKPRLYDRNNKINTRFLNHFEIWFNDNVGFRSKFVLADAKIQYYCFNELTPSSVLKLGENGNLIYYKENVIRNYQHSNLLDDDTLKNVAESFDIVNKYLNKHGIQFYCMRCYDKQTIYPETFMKSVNQYGYISLADQIHNELKKNPNLNIVDTKEDLINAKKTYEVYPKTGDVTHWTQRGAFIGYTNLMEKINSKNDKKFKVLKENDYEIPVKDMSQTLFGNIKMEKDNLEVFDIKEPKAIITNEKLTYKKEDKGKSFYYTNNDANNDTRILILGDSYINTFILDDLAESFKETIQLANTNIIDLQKVVDVYKPNIIIYEQVEREIEYNRIIDEASEIKATNK